MIIIKQNKKTGLMLAAASFIYFVAYFALMKLIIQSHNDSLAYQIADWPIISLVMPVTLSWLGAMIFIPFERARFHWVMSLVFFLLMIFPRVGINMLDKHHSELLIKKAEVVEISHIHNTVAGKKTWQDIEFNKSKYRAMGARNMIVGQELTVKWLESKDGKYQRLSVCVMTDDCYRAY